MIIMIIIISKIIAKMSFAYFRLFCGVAYDSLGPFPSFF